MALYGRPAARATNKFLPCFASAPEKERERLDVRSLREHIEQTDMLDLVPAGGQATEIAGQGGRVAGDIDEPGRCQAQQLIAGRHQVIVAHPAVTGQRYSPLVDFAEMLSQQYDVYTFDFRGHGRSGGWLELDLGKPVEFERAVIKQAYPELKRVKKFTIETWQDGQWKSCYDGTDLPGTLSARFAPTRHGGRFSTDCATAVCTTWPCSISTAWPPICSS